MNDVSTRIVEYLKKYNVPFEQLTHPSAGSAEEYRKTMGTRLEQQAKALFIRFKKTGGKGFAVATIQAQKKVDLNFMCKLLGAREVKLGTLEQLQEVTGCNYGELPPMGKLFAVPLLMDRELLNEPKIYFNAGSLRFSITMDPAELVKLEQPILF
jgi:Ala-tRNA(Pro) deacylase